MFLSRKPTDMKNSLQALSENNLLIKKEELERSRSKLLEEAEKELIERAKRDAELEDIENEDIREKLQSEIEELRKERDDIRGTIKNTEKRQMPSLSTEQEEIIRLLTSHGGSMQEEEIVSESKYDKVRTEYYLEDLEDNGYLSKEWDAGYVYSLTTKSKKIMVEKGFAQ